MDLSKITVLGKPLSDYAYTYASRLWVVTPYYNPMGYKTRRHNYEIFVALLRESGIPVLTVECAFGDQPFDLPESTDVVKVRGNSLLWQKERLINLAVSWLPKSCDYVAWLDADLIFLDPDWANMVVDQLQHYAIVQVFETCDRLPQVCGGADCEHDRTTSFAHMVTGDRSVLRSGKFDEHGHTGYGWAARKEVLDRHGLYEYAITGSGDHYMAHAAARDIDSPCIRRALFDRPGPVQRFREWAEAFDATVQGELGVIPGEVLHLWHGELKDRQYYVRERDLAKLEYDPYTDLIAHPGKLLELRGSGKPGLVEYFKSYFANRREDGVQHVAA